MREYDRIAEWYSGDRSRTIGVGETFRAVDRLAFHSRVLDVGCGTGCPIAAALVAAGYRVVGLDSSFEMLSGFRRNLPETPVVHGDVRLYPFADDTFDAAISWGMLFHLTPRDQATAFASMARVLKAGARSSSRQPRLPACLSMTPASPAP